MRGGFGGRGGRGAGMGPSMMSYGGGGYGGQGTCQTFCAILNSLIST